MATAGFPALNGVVYGLLSPSGKVYIGQAKHLPERLHCHKFHPKSGNVPIGRAIKKYGMENFRIFVLVADANKDWRDFYETMLISFFGDYNLTYGQEGRIGSIPSAKTRRLMSEAQKIAWRKRPKHSPEHIRKFREGCLKGLHRTKGRPLTIAQMENQKRATLAAVHVVRGSKWSNERRAKIAETWRRKLGK